MTLGLFLFFENVENSFDSNRASDGWNILAREHSDEAIVSTSSSNRSHSVSASKDCLENNSRIVIQSSRQTEVELEIVESICGLEIVEEGFHLFHGFLALCVSIEYLVVLELLKHFPWLSLVFDE